MDKKVEDPISKHRCCVSQCKSRNTSEITLLKFPRDENLRKKWAEKLKIEENATTNLYVCSLHFKPTDFQALGYPFIKHRLKRGAIPSGKIPKVPQKSQKKAGRRNLKLKGNTSNAVKTRKTMNNAKQPPTSPDDSDDEPLTCKEILRRCLNKNNTIGSSSKNSFSERKAESPQGVKKKNPVTPFVFVDVSQIKENSEKKSIPRFGRHQPNILRNRRFVTHASSQTPSRKPVTRSIGTQTEALQNFNIESEFPKARFSKNIDFLRRNLVGHALRINGNTFRINECSITFKNEDETKDDISRLIIQPGHLISSGRLMLTSILESCESDRIPKGTKTTQQPAKDSTKSNLPTSSQNIENSVPNEHNYTLKRDSFGTKKNPRVRNPEMKKVTEKLVRPVFDKEVRVKLNKLPKDLLDAYKKGHKIKVGTEEFPQKGRLLRKYTITVIRKEPVNPISCEICDKVFITADALNQHKKFHTDLQKSPPVTNLDRQRLNSVEVVEQQQPIAGTTDTDEKNFVCDMCHRRFKHNHSFVYHRRIVHGKNEGNESIPESLNEEEKNDKIYRKNRTKVRNSEEVVNQQPIKEATSTDERQFNCPLCKRCFKYLHSFNNHLRIIHDWGEEDEYKTEDQSVEGQIGQENTCPECPSTFGSPKDLDKHLLDKHQTVLKKPMYECNICKKIFITYRSLMYHEEKTHNAEINKDVLIKYRCGTCKKLFEIDYYYKSNHEKVCKAEWAKKNAEKTVSNPDLDKSTTPSGPNIGDTTKKEKSSTYLREESSKKEEKKKGISENETNVRKRKNSEDASNTEKKLKSAEEPNEILNRLKNLLGSTDGPNDITIVSIDE
ncbi:uncharacterized protein LOC123320867 isoform X2 [Coccinella septempunctata]|uniref:uncharacterized protein LOC123320867 isoform X2 n=1 Tax=Coccinella septempunctata TaxID=41139 RepID=UPI001D0653D0|nr:uncharacterized protein LOC123320867 isoform X2 [Coccinella septempunctata]